MLRVIVREVDICAAANVGAPVETIYKTFDLHGTAVEDFLREHAGEWVRREIVGAELRPIVGVDEAQSPQASTT